MVQEGMRPNSCSNGLIYKRGEMHLPRIVTIMAVASRSVLRRLRWQAVRRFASCPSCRGMGAHSRDKPMKGRWKHVQDLLFKVRGSTPTATLLLL